MRQPVDAATGAPVAGGDYDTAMAATARRPVTFAEIIIDGLPQGVRVPVTGGRISWSRTRLHQAEGSLEWGIGTPPDPTIVPGAPGTLIQVGVTELRVWSGLVLGDGRVAVCSLGYFIVEDYTFTDGMTVTVTLGARSQRVSRARLEAPVQWTTGMVLEEAVSGMLNVAWPDVDVEIVGDTHTAPALVHETQTDPWEACTAAATSKGCWLYPTGDGRFRWTPEPTLDPTTDAAVFAAGVNLTALARTATIDGFSNRAIASSSKPDLTAPVFGQATLTDPGSAARYDGPIGKIPRWYSSPLIDTTAEAATTAATILRADRPADQLRWSAPVDARLELVDACRVIHPGMWIDQTTFVDDIEFDVAGDLMGCSAGAVEEVVEG